MKALLPIALVLLATPAATEVPPAGPERNERTHLYDLSADVLPQGVGEIGVLWGRWSRGLHPGVQVSSHLGGVLLGLPNVSARYQLLSREELRVTVGLGFTWAAVLLLLQEEGMPTPLLFMLPFELRGTVPLADRLELTFVGRLNGVFTNLVGQAFSNTSVGAEAILVRYDDRGAWILSGRFPLFSQARVRLESLLGNATIDGVITLDDLASWGGMISRDMLFGQTGHLRLGVGYRNTPGILLLQSIGRLTFDLSLYWR